MRFRPELLVLTLLASGCRNLPPPEPVKPVVKPAPVRLVRPMDGQVGQVLTVNPRLRFVVLDYSLTGLPVLGDELDLWRGPSIVGRLKVSGPILNTTAVADIVSGEPQVGDLARPVLEKAAEAAPAPKAEADVRPGATTTASPTGP